MNKIELIIMSFTATSLLALAACGTSAVSIATQTQGQTKSVAAQPSSESQSTSTNEQQPSSSGSTKRPTYTFKTYTNPTYHFSVNYPSGWEIYEKNEIDGLTIVGPEPDFGMVILFRKGYPYDSQSIQNIIVNTKNKFKNFVLLDRQEMKGLWDYYLDYSYIDKPPSLPTEMTWRCKDYIQNLASHAYFLQAAGYRAIYDSYPFPEIVDSFKPGD
jgi:PsbP-like protein